MIEGGLSLRVYTFSETIKLFRINTLKKNDGSLLAVDADVLRRWTKYCENLYNFMINSNYSLMKGGAVA